MNPIWRELNGTNGIKYLCVNILHYNKSFLLCNSPKFSWWLFTTHRHLKLKTFTFKFSLACCNSKCPVQWKISAVYFAICMRRTYSNEPINMLNLLILITSIWIENKCLKNKVETKRTFLMIQICFFNYQNCLN